jgi:hypothetical protein
MNYVLHQQALAYPEGGFGGFKPPPEIIPKFWQSRAKFRVPCKIDLKNLIRIRVSPICKLGGTPDYRVTAPDPCSLCPLSSTEFVVPPPRPRLLGTPLSTGLASSTLPLTLILVRCDQLVLTPHSHATTVHGDCKIVLYNFLTAFFPYIAL